MPIGISLHVGVNDPGPHFPNAATLLGAEKDAQDMGLIAAAKGFIPHELLGPAATYDAVTAQIKSAAATLNEGDMFLFTFAGHGFRMFDQEGDETVDRKDEVLVLFDQELFDDVIRRDLLPLFAAGVRVLGVVDSCHSQSVFAVPPGNDIQPMPMPMDDCQQDDIPVIMSGGLLARTISVATGVQHFKEHGDFYRNIRLPLVSPAINASVLLLAACRDGQTTGDGPNGVYTAAMLKVLREFNPLNYEDLKDKIQHELNKGDHDQTATLEHMGIDDPDFRAQVPFTI